MSQSSLPHIPSSFKTGTLLRLSLACLVLALVTRATYYSLSDGFSLKRIEAPISFQGDISVKPPSKEILETLCTITRQQFRYMKKGSQAYAFISDDDRYILKLFKLHHMQPAEWLQSIPTPGFFKLYRDNLIHRRRYRIELTLTSYKLAAEVLRQECGLLYAQILPSHTFVLPVVIKDAIGRQYSIDLAQHGFAIQRRAELVIPSFDTWIKDGNLSQAKHALDSLVGLIAQRSLKGVQDSDPDLHKNAGLIGNSAILIDIGSFYANPSISLMPEMKRDLKKVFQHFSGWLSKRSPELYNHLQLRLECPETIQWSPSE
jgi:hypothetical protein